MSLNEKTETRSRPGETKKRPVHFTMRKRLDRIRFRGQRKDDFLDLTESPNDSDADGEDVLMNVRPGTSSGDTEDLREDGDPQSDTQAYVGLQDDSRTDLNEVKGHLEIALLEKHFLQEELRKLRDESHVDLLKQDLEQERRRRLELEQKLNEVLRPRPEDTPPQAPKAPPPPLPGLSGPDRQKDSLSSRLKRRFYERFGVYVEDFRRVTPEETPAETEEPLSAKRLTENTRRLKRGSKPVVNFMKNLSALSSWRSIYTSAIAFTVYMYAAWYGWLVSVFLFLAVLRLSLNYLIARGWRIEWSIVPEVSDPVEPPKEDLTVSEKFQLVLDVAQKAQNLFGKTSDVLEKIKNLLTWAEPELTQKLYVALWVAFISSCVLPYSLLGFIIAVYAGIKFFIISFVFHRCPGLRERYDTPYVVWTRLPTDPQLRERGAATPSRRGPPAASLSGVSGSSLGFSRDEDGGRTYSCRRGAFHDVFGLPETERPLAACENGWRCCLINRDRKTPTEYIRNGVLYITENFLCFESRSSSSKRNKVIRLVDITDIQKYKVLSVLPGSGMGISIATPYTQKPLVFGAMGHRDEAFDAIFSQYMKIIANMES